MSLAIRKSGVSDVAGNARAKLASLRTIVRTIIAALSKLEHSAESQRLAADYLIYFRNALAQLDRFDTRRQDEITALAGFAEEVEKVATVCLVLIQQGNLMHAIDRISGDISMPPGHARHC